NRAAPGVDVVGGALLVVGPRPGQIEYVPAAQQGGAVRAFRSYQAFHALAELQMAAVPTDGGCGQIAQMDRRDLIDQQRTPARGDKPNRSDGDDRKGAANEQ